MNEPELLSKPRALASGFRIIKAGVMRGFTESATAAGATLPNAQAIGVWAVSEVTRKAISIG